MCVCVCVCVSVCVCYYYHASVCTGEKGARTERERDTHTHTHTTKIGVGGWGGDYYSIFQHLVLQASALGDRQTDTWGGRFGEGGDNGVIGPRRDEESSNTL